MYSFCATMLIFSNKADDIDSSSTDDQEGLGMVLAPVCVASRMCQDEVSSMICLICWFIYCRFYRPVIVT
jgi:hypothetical protein